MYDITLPCGKRSCAFEADVAKIVIRAGKRKKSPSGWPVLATCICLLARLRCDIFQYLLLFIIQYTRELTAVFTRTMLISLLTAPQHGNNATPTPKLFVKPIAKLHITMNSLLACLFQFQFVDWRGADIRQPA